MKNIILPRQTPLPLVCYSVLLGRFRSPTTSHCPSTLSSFCPSGGGGGGEWWDSVPWGGSDSDQAKIGHYWENPLLGYGRTYNYHTPIRLQPAISNEDIVGDDAGHWAQGQLDSDTIFQTSTQFVAVGISSAWYKEDNLCLYFYCDRPWALDFLAWWVDRHVRRPSSPYNFPRPSQWVTNQKAGDRPRAWQAWPRLLD